MDCWRGGLSRVVGIFFFLFIIARRMSKRTRRRNAQAKAKARRSLAGEHASSKKKGMTKKKSAVVKKKPSKISVPAKKASKSKVVSSRGKQEKKQKKASSTKKVSRKKKASSKKTDKKNLGDKAVSSEKVVPAASAAGNIPREKRTPAKALLVCHMCGASFHIGCIASIVDDDGCLYCSRCTHIVSNMRLRRENEKRLKMGSDKVGKRLVAEMAAQQTLVIPKGVMDPEAFDLRLLRRLVHRTQGLASATWLCISCTDHFCKQPIAEAQQKQQRKRE